MRISLIILLIINNAIGFAQTKSVQSDWKTYSENVNNGYNVQFDYPTNLKFDRIENCMCLGKPNRNTDYNNTMDWGIWINEPQNYNELGTDYYKKEFKNDFIIKMDSVIISNFKALHIVVKQAHGKRYEESIVLKFKDCIFEISNKSTESVDFIKFYKSIRIKKK